MPVSTQSVSPLGLELRFGIDFADLYDRKGLLRIDDKFIEHLQSADIILASRLLAVRANPVSLAPKQASELIIALAPHLDDFVAYLFAIETEMEAMQASHNALSPLLNAKRRFVQKRALTGAKKEEAEKLDSLALESDLTAR